MNELIRTIMSGMELGQPGTEEKLAEAEEKLGIRFPEQYREFILAANGAEGGVGANAYLQLWPADVLAQYNIEDYEVDKFNPGLVYIGSDGGDMAVAFDKRAEPHHVVMLPFVSVDLEEVEDWGETFYEFLENLYYAEYDEE